MKRKKTFFYLPLFFTVVFLVLQLLSMHVLGWKINWPILPLIVPVISIINLLFFVYWIMRFQWPLLLFVIVLALSYEQWTLLYQFKRKGIETAQGLEVMSFNVRSFNRFKWLKENNVPQAIAEFISAENPDVICFQEFSKSQSPNFKEYRYHAFVPYREQGQIGVSILSKYPLIKVEPILLTNASNGGMKARMIKSKDTLNLYNIHFESLRMDVNDSMLTAKYSQKLRSKLSTVFQQQIEQAEQFLLKTKEDKGTSVICMDLNNTAFSKSYFMLKKDRQDCFQIQGSGFGGTYQFPYFPLRIDFILASPELNVLDFKTHKIKLSDHKPITAKLEWP